MGSRFREAASGAAAVATAHQDRELLIKSLASWFRMQHTYLVSYVENYLLQSPIAPFVETMGALRRQTARGPVQRGAPGRLCRLPRRLEGGPDSVPRPFHQGLPARRQRSPRPQGTHTRR